MRSELEVAATRTGLVVCGSWSQCLKNLQRAEKIDGNYTAYISREAKWMDKYNKLRVKLQTGETTLQERNKSQ